MDSVQGLRERWRLPPRAGRLETSPSLRGGGAHLGADLVGDAAGYLIGDLEVRTVVFRDRVIALNLPLTVELTVSETAPAIKGATAQAQLEPATLETGLQVQVPPYVEAGERVRVDARDGRFVERAK